MRIIQIIDSLDAGGAERMAVNYANALSDKIEFSGLVVTRKEGPLLRQICDNVSYLFLNKRSSIDVQALYKLRKFVQENNVTMIHAHSTSFFFAFLLKLSIPSVQLIWHDHYGDSEFLNQRPTISLKLCLLFFNGIIAVNQKLKTWDEEKMHFKNVIYLPNFPSTEIEGKHDTVLFGIKGKRILSLANLRVQKNHFMLLEVAKRIKLSHPEWTFHLVGKDFEDDYSKQIKKLIIAFNLEKSVFIYGSKQDIGNILTQSTIAILTSQSEGLPVALLEYGLHKLPVVVTAVGEIPMVIQEGVNGFLITSNQVELFNESLVKLIENDTIQLNFGNELYKTIHNSFSEQTIITNYLKWLTNNVK
ncbi:glycosyltransferase [Flavobacterium cellulosilyticum]|uniref:Glycosyltransferase n=1 Tax=Flavobacterium cellulosilyticum TaxID=2541731 RepID=A0A4R5C7V9_9FLAO|nr:glycosyltransferase [Flavobacterium cellulosilyticum]TDD95205.1 glycosyltransferase [Flavobacterium cellulosilyticum]